MKKFFFFAFMALSLSAAAQHVTPISFEIVDLKIDSLRALYLSEPMMYRASLEMVGQNLAKNAEQIKTAKEELKDEQNHAKEMGNSLKDALKMTAALKKIYGKEEGELKSMQKTVEKQQRKLITNKRLNKEARDSYSQMLDKQQKELGYSLREVAERQRSVAELETSIQNWQSALQAYEQEVQQKASELASLEALYKERQATLKTEQKSAKSLQ